MRYLLTFVLISALSACQVVDILKPTDPCARIFDTTYAQMECRVEQGLQLEADRIIAKAQTLRPGDNHAKARLQKRLDKVKELRDQKRAAANLFNKGKTGDAETQLELLITALEGIK